jgi:hypothetical protein
MGLRLGPLYRGRNIGRGIYCRALKKILERKRDELKWEWKGLHNEELYDVNPSLYIVYHSGDESKKNEMGGASCMYGREERFMQLCGGDI